MKTQQLVFFLVISLLLYSNVVLPKLDTHEVEVLKEIWGKLNLPENKGWGSATDPCSINTEGKNISVECDCSFEGNTTCHAIAVAIKNQNVSTTLPLEFTKLRYLRFLELSRNCLYGTIPSEWATMHLTNLSLLANKFSGVFPMVLTRMTILIDLSIEGNRFSGPIPKEIAKLKNLKKLVLSSNDFTGELPFAFAKFTNLIILRIKPYGELNYIKRHIQGCSFEGPFPSGISALTRLNDLRVSDLKGGVSTFPRLKSMINLKKLILRNCIINGTIPIYVWHMKYLDTLDLSFNNFSGIIPDSFFEIEKAKYIYLTMNNLTGPIPRWILSNSKTVDVSYNNFTWDTSGPRDCIFKANMMESYSGMANRGNIDIHPCLLKGFPCNGVARLHTLHINCGGKEVKANNKVIYEADTGLSMQYYISKHNWAFSQTGNFLDDGRDSDIYVLSNASNLHNISRSDTELYTTARTTPVALTYYGLCLINGNYNVSLHFVEIVFTQDTSFASLGKRIFDVYVQGELKLKDFDIVKEAGGTGRVVIKTYMVDVIANTLKIQLYWAGKGTTGIPSRGSYGPIISAISIKPNFEPPKYEKDENKNKVKVIVGVVAGAFVVIAGLVSYFGHKLWRKWCISSSPIEELSGINLHTVIISSRHITAATNDFSPSNQIGRGGFGTVYRGELRDGTYIAVKRLSADSKQGLEEFFNEVSMMSLFNHPSLVRLYGCCLHESNTGPDLCLVYEYMENNSLQHALLGGNDTSRFTWPVRFKL
ncbi:hypothetical protein QVD17_26088 [Tagetes erecta]|uniref:non-specific serine/threonine protein kinase n=1 Tax=Tagetes erecta TaxID=13708 RepID=A0AAD8K6S6_TARER|nr:hypothetical protein QVD17_26088 [Tagetes erecta]